MMTFPIYGQINSMVPVTTNQSTSILLGSPAKKTAPSNPLKWFFLMTSYSELPNGSKTRQKNLAALRERATENASRFNRLLCPVYLYNLVYIYILLYIVYSQLLIYVCIIDTQNIITYLSTNAYKCTVM